MVYDFLGLLVESCGTCLLLQRLVDASKDSDIPKNVPFAFVINNRNILGQLRPEMFPGIGALPKPATESHVVNRGTLVAPCRLRPREKESPAWEAPHELFEEPSKTLITH